MLDEIDIGDEQRVVMRGILDPDSFTLLRIGSYQRAALPRHKILEIAEGFKAAEVPDIDLGVRGKEDWTSRGDATYIPGDVYVIDGQQRVLAGEYTRIQGKITPHLGATIHFGTTEEWERRRFDILNFHRTQVSSNIRLRNKCQENRAIEALTNLSAYDKGFVLCGRVNWDQYMQKDHLVTAFTFFRTVGMLHGHLGHSRAAKVEELADGLFEIMERIGEDAFRHNVITFFNVIDQCWGVKAISFRSGATQMKTTFLATLASIFSDHPVFWRDNRLFVEKDLITKMRMFNIGDPTVVRLAGSAGQARGMLYDLLLRHINSRKRGKRLVHRE